MEQRKNPFIEKGDQFVRTGTLWVGTSNIAIPGAKHTFPEAYRSTTRLTYHGALFNSLEVNSTFYTVPQGKTVARWAAEVPDNFRITLKVHQGITHQKQLQYSDSDIIRFVDVANNIGSKKGCLLVQFPGSINIDYRAKVEHILAVLHDADADNAWSKAIEFRHPSWYNRYTEDLLDKYGMALVIHDIPKSKILEPNAKAPFVYWRFHGEAGDFKGSYDIAVLNDYAARISDWMKSGRDVYVYFNNTIGDAFENARTLRALIEKK